MVIPVVPSVNQGSKLHGSRATFPTSSLAHGGEWSPGVIKLYSRSDVDRAIRNATAAAPATAAIFNAPTTIGTASPSRSRERDPKVAAAAVCLDPADLTGANSTDSTLCRFDVFLFPGAIIPRISASCLAKPLTVASLIS